MKLTVKQYAKIILKNASADKKTLAHKFWFALQKNNQYKDLPKIVAELDKEYARQKNSIFVEIVSENKLSDNDVKEIEAKLIKLLDNQPRADRPKVEKIISKNIIKPNFGPGIVVKTDEMEIDISVIGKIDRLKQIITHNS